MTTYLTLVGMLLLVVSPVLIPLTVTVIHFCSDRFGRIANWRKTMAARPLPGPVRRSATGREFRWHHPRHRRPQCSSIDLPRRSDDHDESRVHLLITRAMNPVA
jgi:hypothetical protein